MRCEDCKWFDVTVTPLLGKCKRNPPIALADKFGWPLVGPDEYCGEYEVRVSLFPRRGRKKKE